MEQSQVYKALTSLTAAVLVDSLSTVREQIEEVPWVFRVSIFDEAIKHQRDSIALWLAETYYDCLIGRTIVQAVETGQVDTVKTLLDNREAFLAGEINTAITECQTTSNPPRPLCYDDLIGYAKRWMAKYHDLAVVRRRCERYRDKQFDQIIDQSLKKATNPVIRQLLLDARPG